jgi:GDPmannose 4,6-dehydratase
MAKSALILGITGQDGAYLSHHLLSLGYKVIGSSRDCFSCDTSRLKCLDVLHDIEMCSLVPTDFRSVLKSVSQHQPDEIYNLSGLSSVGLSFELPVECIESIATATVNLLEVIRFMDCGIKFFNAGSSECFGDIGQTPANESTLFKPLSPYAVAKSSAFWQISSYRRAYNLHCCTGILSNHESPLRPRRFVVQKIVYSARQILQKKVSSVNFGNLDVYRDWGWAADYVKAMHLMLQSDTPKDFIVATGVTSSLRDLAEEIFQFYDLSFSDLVKFDSSFVRPSDLRYSSLDSSAICKELGWSSIVNTKEIVRRLCTDQFF